MKVATRILRSSVSSTTATTSCLQRGPAADVGDRTLPDAGQCSQDGRSPEVASSPTRDERRRPRGRQSSSPGPDGGPPAGSPSVPGAVATGDGAAGGSGAALGTGATGGAVARRPRGRLVVAPAPDLAGRRSARSAPDAPASRVLAHRRP